MSARRARRLAWSIWGVSMLAVVVRPFTRKLLR